MRRGQICKRKKCSAWYRPNRYRSAGKYLEFCSLKCMKKAQEETVVKQEIERDW